MKYTIGRSENNDIVINDKSNIVSSNHAVFEEINGKFYITDISTNGTFVKGKKIPKDIKFPIKKGDEILFAKKYQFDWNKIKPVSKNEIVNFDLKKLMKSKIAIIAIVLISFIGIIFFATNGLNYNAQDLHKKYNKSVVLIYHSFYYTIEIDNSPAVYIGRNDQGKYDFSLKKSEINPISSEGTGFFISSSGNLITNRHVAYPWTSNEDESEFRMTNPELFEVYNFIITDINKYLNKNNKGHLKRNLSGQTVFIGIATNNTFVNSIDDFTECVTIKHHQDYEIDLALMQTSDKSLPKDANYIPKSKFSNEISVGEMATIIGYPGGSNFQSKKGNSTELKVITNEGPITQQPGEKKVMYQVPTTHGASGSPVFNNRGELIAVNFSGYSAQGFNFGVLVKHIDELIK